jgi:hypothetical protein
MRGWIAAALLLAVTGCPTRPATQIVVEIDAESGVRADLDVMHIVVNGGDGSTVGAPGIQRLDVRERPPRWPFTVVIAPLDRDPERRYEVVVTAEDAEPVGGGVRPVVARVRAISGFVPGETRVLRLMLEDACRGVTCDAAETCRVGVCESAVVVPASIGVDAGHRDSMADADTTSEDAGPSADAAPPWGDAAPPPGNGGFWAECGRPEDAACGAGMACVTYVTSGVMGRRCETRCATYGPTPPDCGGGACVSEVQDTETVTYCTTPCDPFAGDPCRGTASCLLFEVGGAWNHFYCVGAPSTRTQGDACTSLTGCAPGLVCDSVCRALCSDAHPCSAGTCEPRWVARGVEYGVCLTP